MFFASIELQFKERNFTFWKQVQSLQWMIDHKYNFRHSHLFQPTLSMDALHQVCLMNQINEYWETFHCKLFVIYKKIVNIIYFYNSYCRISRSLTCSRTNNEFETMFFYDLSIKELLLSFTHNNLPFQIDSNVWGWLGPKCWFCPRQILAQGRFTH